MVAPALVTVGAPPIDPPSQDDAPAGSMLASLRAQAAAQRADKHVDIPIGGDLEDLVVRYGYLSQHDMDRYVELAPGGGQRTSTLASDMLVSACRTVLYRHQGELHDLEVRLGGKLWELLGWKLPAGIERVEDIPPQDVVLALFGGNAMALLTHATQVITWMQGTAEQPGEPSAATS